MRDKGAVPPLDRRGEGVGAVDDRVEQSGGGVKDGEEAVHDRADERVPARRKRGERGADATAQRMRERATRRDDGGDRYSGAAGGEHGASIRRDLDAPLECMLALRRLARHRLGDGIACL